MSIALMLPQRHTRWNADTTDKACLHTALCKGAAAFHQLQVLKIDMPCSTSEASWLAEFTFVLIFCCLSKRHSPCTPHTPGPIRCSLKMIKSTR